MKKTNLLLFALCVVLSLSIRAQNVGIGTTSPQASAQLDVSSTNRGILIPRLTSVQRTTIASPAKGLMVFDNDSSCFAVYNGTTWRFIKMGGNNAEAWSTSGNSGTGNNSFIGTTDNQPLRFRVQNTPAGFITGSNTAFGLNAMHLPRVTGFRNIAIGNNPLFNNTSGFQNIAIGESALTNNTTGSDNTAIGPFALNSNRTGAGNIAIGRDAMASADSAILNNVAIGVNALVFSKGNGNTAVGSGAISFGKGYSNVAVGFDALAISDNGNNIVAIGDSSLRFNGLNTTQPFEGSQNTAVGSKALMENRTGYFNTAVGFESLKSNNSGRFNTALGSEALRSNQTGVDNVAMGDQALTNNTLGNDNTAIGHQALNGNETGSRNTALGSVALGENRTGRFNTAVGFASMLFNESGASNTAIGESALYANKTGNGNVALGAAALFWQDKISYNIAIGDSALLSNGLGATLASHSMENLAIGSKAMYENTTGSNNLAVGANALFSNKTGGYNTAIGHNSLSLSQNGFNTAVGYLSLYYCETGNENTALGFQSLSNTSTGYGNTGIGLNAMLANTTGSINTTIGANANVGAPNLINATAIGAGALVSQSNSMVLGSIAGQNGATVNTKVGIGSTQPSSLFTVRGVENVTPLVNIFQFGTQAPALKISASSGNNGGLELENAAIKVSGGNKAVFQITAVTGAGGNTTGNTLTIPNTGFANASTDLLVVTPVYTSTNVYCNFPIGVWWDSGQWKIFNQNLGAMPNGAVFNVLVVKQ